MIKTLAAVGATAASIMFAPIASADPPPWADPHYPDYTKSHCEGGHGAFIIGWCDGAPYPDGT